MTLQQLDLSYFPAIFSAHCLQVSNAIFVKVGVPLLVLILIDDDSIHFVRLAKRFAISTLSDSPG
jgi:hypothetical protein